MSFVEVPGPHYIKRTLVFVNSNNSDPVRSTSNYDFSFNLVEEIQEVFSIELVNFTIPRTMTPTFLGKIDQFALWKTGVIVYVPQNSNMLYDLRIENETRTSSLLVSGGLDPGFLFLGLGTVVWSGFPLDQLVMTLAFLFDLSVRFQLAVFGDPVFGTGSWGIGAGFDQNFQLFMGLENSAPIPPTYGYVSALFRTGPNKDNQISIPLGFTPDVDQINDGSEDRNALWAPYMLNPTPFTYVDVFLAQAAENEPWARIYTVDEVTKHSTPKTVPYRSRMLKTPVRNLKFLDFTIRTRGGRVLTEVSNTGMDMTVEVLSIAQVPKVPDWVIQRLTL